MTKFENRKAQGGFTLLEMLVTVGIMAAVAGTATLALQDTTARASAAAHVAMMDELNEGIRAFRALPGANNNTYPNNFDSLLQVSAAPTAGSPLTGTATFSKLAINDIGLFTLTDQIVSVMGDIGMKNLQYVNTSFTNWDGTGTRDPAQGPADTLNQTCGNAEALINSRSNAVVAGNIFMSPDANGCGVSRALEAGDQVAVWTGGNERVLGNGAPNLSNPADATDAANQVGAKVMMAVGAGPSSNLFDASVIGGLTSVPVYRHVGADEYNRFIVLFHIATIANDGTNNVFQPVDQIAIAGVVDGAGDTKEEELGEWDGSRNTI